MKGAIFFSSKYGSTAQYANWIGEETGLPVFDVKEGNTDPSNYDFLILGSPIIYYKLTIHKWVKKHLAVLETKPIVLFSVSGARAGPKLDGWIANCLPARFILKMNHVALGGRQKPKELTLYDRIMLKIAGIMNTDRKAGKEEFEGFDFMDKSSIKPILEMVKKLQL